MVSAPALMLKLGRVLGIAGMDVVMAKLDEIEQDSPESPSVKLEAFIVDQVCDRFNTSKERLMKERVDGDDLSARNLCFVLIQKHISDYSYDKIGKVFKKTPQSVSIALKNFSRMKTNIKHEREFIEAYTEINKKINDYKSLNHN